MIGKGKLVLVFVIAMVMISSFSSLAAEEVIKVSIDGKYVEYSDTTGYPFIDENNYIQIPLRTTLEAFETMISYPNEATTVSQGGNTGEMMDSNATSVIQNNTVYVPIRILMEVFGCDVSWSSEENTVEINSEIPTNEENDKKPEVKIEAPDETKEDEATIKIITDKDNAIFLNGDKIEVDHNNEYVVNLPEEENEFIVKVVNQYGVKTEESFTIEKIVDKIYLDVGVHDSRVSKKRVTISGRTNPGNEVRINNTKIVLNSNGGFTYRFTDLEPEYNTIVVSAKNDELDEEIEKKLKVYYRLKENEDDEEELDDKQVKEITEVINKDADEDSDPPIIIFDKEIPKTTDKTTITISGVCKNAKYMVANGASLKGERIKVGEEKKFSYDIELLTGENGGTQSEKGVSTYIQIYAVNEDKIIVYEYIIYYKESDSSEE